MLQVEEAAIGRYVAEHPDGGFDVYDGVLLTDEPVSLDQALEIIARNRRAN